MHWNPIYIGSGRDERDSVDAEHFKEAAGWSYFSQGVGTVIGAPLTGMNIIIHIQIPLTSYIGLT